jgi:hypothetical protein
MWKYTVTAYDRSAQWNATGRRTVVAGPSIHLVETNCFREILRVQFADRRDVLAMDQNWHFLTSHPWNNADCRAYRYGGEGTTWVIKRVMS